MALDILRLIPTQGGLRDRKRALHLADKVKAGYFFVDNPAPISITKFEDGQLYVHNGHHRVVACILGGRNELRADEYQIQRWTYLQYDEISWEHNYVTPFHPVTETKVPDLSNFKQAVEYTVERNGREAAELFIRKHKWLYARPRRVDEFWELAVMAHADLPAA